MFKKIAVLMIFFMCALNVLAQGQGVTKEDILTEGDSTFYMYLGTSAGANKWCRATVYNSDNSLTDTAGIYHVTRFDKSPKDSVYNRIGYKKWNVSENAVQNDTVYYEIILAPGEKLEILVWFPFPDAILWDLYNAEYSTDRIMRLKARLFND